MRKRAKKLLALLTAVTITVTGVNVPAAQAAKVKVTASKTTLYYNGTSAEKKATVTVKNVKGKKVTYSISKAGKKIVKLGDVSGNKTKKFTVTAKKKGTAKVTVKVAGKKVKTIKFTVKKKSTATPKPTVAPTQAPTQEPSQEPTVAPSDEPTVAPTDAPSDEPTVAPTDAPVEKSVVTEIKILNDVALTNGANKAYVYYDVLDQYGKSMRESCSINWSTSPTQCTADKQTGRLTITNTQDFKYGDYIVITGVHAQSGVSVSKTLTAGLQQQIDTINFEGFVKDNEKNKLLETVGADFDKGTSDYYLAFTAKDQNGNDYEFTTAADANDVTFTSDNPLLLSVKSDSAKLFTISDKTYVGVKVAPGMYADKGGEVNITAISNKTGGKVTKNFVIGSAGVLASLELLAPTTDVCDGESVELKYVAKDTAGNEITNYETIIRSTNSLTLNVSDGELKISENNDGTAKVTWSDVDYDATATATYGESVVSDGIARPISVSTVVIGGSNSFMQFQVNDIRIPVAASIEDQTVASKGTVEYKACYANYDGNIAFTDQYGKTLSNKKATAFLQYARANKFGGANKAYYSLAITSNQTADVVNRYTPSEAGDGWHMGTATNGAVAGNDTYVGTDYFNFGVQFAAKEVTTPDDVATATFKASIVKCDVNSFDDNTLEAVGKIDSAVVTVVPLNLINTFEVSATSKTLRLAPNGAFDAVTTGSATYKVNEPMTVAGDNGDNAKVSVIGKYKGTSLAIADAYISYTNDVVTVAGGKITGVTANQVAKSQAFDLKTANEYGATAQEFSLDLNVKVDAKQTGDFVAETVQDLSKSITFKYEDQVATAVSFGANATPGKTDIDSVVAWSGVSDQFGNKMTGQDIVYSVTNIKENTGDLAHVADSFVVEGNGSAAVSIKGAEVGDEFDVVATVKGTKVTSTVHVTVTADSYANITATKTGVTDNDKTLRGKLKYTR